MRELQFFTTDWFAWDWIRHFGKVAGSGGPKTRSYRSSRFYGLGDTVAKP